MIFLAVIFTSVFVVFLLILSIKKPKIFFSITVFTILIWPSYIAIKIGDLPGLTPDRILIFCLIISMVVNILYNKKFVINIYKYKKIITIFVVYFLWLVFSSILASEEMLKTLYASINLFIIGPFLAIFMLVFIQKEKEYRNILFVMIAAFYVMNVFGIIELILQKPLFANFIVQTTEYNKWISNIEMRDGVYRIESVFSNSLTYAQVLLVSIIFYIYVIKMGVGKIYKYFLIINIIISYCLIYYTGSRTGLALALLYPFVLFYIYLHKKTGFSFRKNFINFVLIPILICFVAFQIYINIDLALDLRNQFIHHTLDEQALSSLVRVAQIIDGFQAFLQSPFIGYGTGEATREFQLVNVIDNYYLSILLSSGLVGLIIYFYLCRTVFKIGFQLIKRYHDRDTIFLISALFMILIFYAILSVAIADTIFYIIVALIFLRQKFLLIEERVK